MKPKIRRPHKPTKVKASKKQELLARAKSKSELHRLAVIHNESDVIELLKKWNKNER